MKYLLLLARMDERNDEMRLGRFVLWTSPQIVALASLTFHKRAKLKYMLRKPDVSQRFMIVLGDKLFTQ